MQNMARRCCKTRRQGDGQGEATIHIQVSTDEDMNQDSDHCVGRREQNKNKYQVHEMPKNKVGINEIFEISGLHDAFN